ncbi:MAG TPA: CHRD domain-containing protein [Chitinophagaceae bacterium]|nr:CHRD domain-containing protein [Chitinophagaceae bacterium]
MKSSLSRLSRGVVLFSFGLLGAFALVSCGREDEGLIDEINYTLSGNATGAQMVPAVTGNGTGTFTGSYNPGTMVMTYTTNWSNLSGAPTSGGFYAGASGAAGTAVGSPWTMGGNLTGTGMHSGTMTLTADQANQLLNGGWYYSMGTGTNPGGEVRGQITATR